MSDTPFPVLLDRASIWLSNFCIDILEVSAIVPTFAEDAPNFSAASAHSCKDLATFSTLSFNPDAVITPASFVKASLVYCSVSFVFFPYRSIDFAQLSKDAFASSMYFAFCSTAFPARSDCVLAVVNFVVQLLTRFSALLSVFSPF